MDVDLAELQMGRKRKKTKGKEKHCNGIRKRRKVLNRNMRISKELQIKWKTPAQNGLQVLRVIIMPWLHVQK